MSNEGIASVQFKGLSTQETRIEEGNATDAKLESTVFSDVEIAT